ncbi:MAG: hypothetical protein SV765_00280 [Pseudomonadota bacterium]|nr:hypothetical protein [Pseudomonadota bacterium]
MSENINDHSHAQDVSTDIDTDQREAITRKEEEEKKRLAQLREQETTIQKDSLDRDDSEISEEEKREPTLRIDGDTVVVENFGEKNGDFAFSNVAERDIALLDDGTIAVSQKGNAENRYLISSNEERVVEYDFSNFDVADLNKNKLNIEFENLIEGKSDFEVKFSIDKEGNIEVDSVRGDAAGKINFKNGDTTYTIDKDGQLVELADAAKEQEKDNLNAALDGIDLSGIQGVKDSADDRQQKSAEGEHLDAAISELDLSEVQTAEHSSAPASAETGETPRAR